MLHFPALLTLFLFLPALSLQMRNTFPRSVLRPYVGKTAAQRDLLPVRLVSHFSEISSEAVFAGTENTYDAGTSGKTSFRLRLHNHDLPFTGDSDPFVIGAPKI